MARSRQTNGQMQKWSRQSSIHACSETVSVWDERPSASYGIEEFYGLKPQAQMHTNPPIVFNTFSRMDDIRRAISVHQLGQKKEARSSSETLSLSPPIRGKLDVFFRPTRSYRQRCFFYFPSSLPGIISRKKERFQADTISISVSPVEGALLITVLSRLHRAKEPGLLAHSSARS